MGQADRDAALATAGMELELLVAEQSGLQEALGGREQTQAALVAAWNPLVIAAQSTSTIPISLGLRRSAPEAPSLGEGLFGGALLVALGAEAAVGATNDLKPGPPVSESSGNGFTVSGSQNSAELTYSGTHTDSDTGVTTKLAARATVVPCPDVNGKFQASGEMDVTASKGSASQHGTLEVNIAGQVDDDAQLVSSDLDYRMQWSKTSGGSGAFVDVSVGLAAAGGSTSTVNRTGGAVTAELTGSAVVGGMLYAVMLKHFLEEAAKKGWESGRCVQLNVTPDPAPKDMIPSSTAEITAQPRSKIDGSATGGTVTATLTSGGSSVDPSASPVQADANMTYTANAEPNNHGTVSFEARSKRGVAKAEITFETRGPASYQIVGGAGDFQVNNAVCDIMKPFTLSGGGFTASYTGGLSGSHSYTGPFNATGGGTYTITLPDGPGNPGSMHSQGEGSVETPLGVFSNSGEEEFTLTPITGCIEDG